MAFTTLIRKPTRIVQIGGDDCDAPTVQINTLNTGAGEGNDPDPDERPVLDRSERMNGTVIR